jgi:hypothetical protein
MTTDQTEVVAKWISGDDNLLFYLAIGVSLEEKEEPFLTLLKWIKETDALDKGPFRSAHRVAMSLSQMLDPDRLDVEKLDDLIANLAEKTWPFLLDRDDPYVCPNCDGKKK